MSSSGISPQISKPSSSLPKPAKERRRIKQSVCWWCFLRGDIKPERLIKEAAAIGYASIEL